MDAFLLFLPTLNAFWNATCATCLVAGFWAIRRGKKQLHMRCMLAALAASTLFLAGYLTRVALAGTHRFPADGLLKHAYLALLVSHMILAVVLLPMVARSLFLATRQRFPEHKRMARWTWPTWIYVSVTGVVVYVMLYHVAPSLSGG